ncbi:MAG: hypothetical protein K6F68_05310 [Clostridiales bacterium]|nr:hypothetical protein [Clostridiales bacterium]
MSALTLKIITPTGENPPVGCDSVTVFARGAGEDAGGSVGIRRGHVPAVIALEENSPIRAKENSAEAFYAAVSGGFLYVKNDVLTVITDSVSDTGSGKKHLRE